MEKKYRISILNILFMFNILVTIIPYGMIYSISTLNNNIRIFFVLQFTCYFISVVYCLIKYFNRNRYIILLELWSAIVCISTYMYSNSFVSLFKAISSCLSILSLALVIYTFYYIHKQKKMYNFLFILFSIICLLNVASVFLYPEGVYQSGWQGANYLYGGKFTSFYIYYVWILSTILVLKNVNKIFLFSQLIFGLILCDRIDCSTGIAVLLVTCLLLLVNKTVSILMPSLVILSILVITFFMTQSTYIFNIPIVQKFIVNVLHRSTLLTGRVDIYGSFMDIMKNNLIFGVGYASDIIKENTVRGYLNAQNGTLDIIVQSGFFGLLIFYLWLYKTLATNFTYNARNIIKKYVWIFLIGMFVCSIVEISYNYFFFLIVFIFSNITDNRGTIDE